MRLFVLITVIVPLHVLANDFVYDGACLHNRTEPYLLADQFSEETVEQVSETCWAVAGQNLFNAAHFRKTGELLDFRYEHTLVSREPDATDFRFVTSVANGSILKGYYCGGDPFESLKAMLAHGVRFSTTPVDVEAVQNNIAGACYPTSNLHEIERMRASVIQILAASRSESEKSQVTIDTEGWKAFKIDLPHRYLPREPGLRIGHEKKPCDEKIKDTMAIFNHLLCKRIPIGIRYNSLNTESLFEDDDLGTVWGQVYNPKYGSQRNHSAVIYGVDFDPIDGMYYKIYNSWGNHSFSRIFPNELCEVYGAYILALPGERDKLPMSVFTE
jgi:hypothetical protein